MLNKARQLATEYHQGQVDKSGRDYRIHLERVSQCCRGYSETAQVVALLHDIIEDTSCTIEVCGINKETPAPDAGRNGNGMSLGTQQVYLKNLEPIH